MIAQVNPPVAQIKGEEVVHLFQPENVLFSNTEFAGVTQKSCPAQGSKATLPLG